MERLRELESMHPDFRSFDANRRGLHSFSPFDFVDPSHLPGSGARIMTKQVDNVFQTFRASEMRRESPVRGIADRAGAARLHSARLPS